MNILENVDENSEFRHNKSTKPKKQGTGKFQSNDIQMHVGIAYNEILRMLSESSSDFQLPDNGVKTLEKLELIQKTVEYLIQSRPSSKNLQNSQLDQSNLITCTDCQQYESSLQKYENEVRQHIRLQQQLKIYQESMEEKIEELKKEKINLERKSEEYKKKNQEVKSFASGVNEKLHKLQLENDKLKSELRSGKHSTLENSKKLKGYESKENRIDWAHRVSHHKKEDHTGKMTDRTERKSVDKRGESSDRWRMSTTNIRSTKTAHLNDRAVTEKNREQRKKAIQAKFEHRR